MELEPHLSLTVSELKQMYAIKSIYLTLHCTKQVPGSQVDEYATSAVF